MSEVCPSDCEGKNVNPKIRSCTISDKAGYCLKKAKEQKSPSFVEVWSGERGTIRREKRQNGKDLAKLLYDKEK